MKIFKLGLFIFAFSLFFVLGANPVFAVVDLQVNSVTVSPESPAKGETVTITVKILNNGDEALLDDTGIKDYNLTISDFDQTTVNSPSVSASSPLAANATINYVFKGSFYSTGNKNINFQIDYYDLLDEWREVNNSIVEKITVLKTYDIKIESIVLTPTKPAVEQDCYITVTAKNSGYGSLKDSTGVTSVAYLFENFIEKSKELPVIDSMHNVDSGDTFEYIYYGYFDGEGEQALSFEIDKNDQMDEQSETNNIMGKTATVVSPLAIDLSVESIAIDKSSPILNDEVVVTITIKNTGLVTLISDKGFRHEQDLSVYPVIGKEIIFESDNFKQTGFSAGSYPSVASPLEPGEKYTYKYTGQLINKPGEHTFSFRVNTNDRLKENDLSNNTFTKTIYVYADTNERDGFTLDDIQVEHYSATSARVTWQTSKEASSYMEYKRSTFTGWEKTSVTTDFVHSRNLKNLVAGRAYDYRIYATYGTIDKEELDLKFDLPDASTVEIISGPQLTISSQNIAVSWETNLLTKAILYYRQKGKEEFTSVEIDEYQLNHKIEVNNLAFDDYEYFVLAIANTMEQSESAMREFTIVNPSLALVSTSTAVIADKPKSATTSSELNNVATEKVVNISNKDMYRNLRGKIILTVEQAGEAYYVNPNTQTHHFLGRPDDAFAVMREQGIGISNENLYKIPIGLSGSGTDSDADGLSDYLEETIGLRFDAGDTDGDGYNDKDELINGYNPWGEGRQNLDDNFSKAQGGRILLQVEKNGEAWYVSPVDNKRYFLGRPADAFAVMRELGLGISDSDFDSL
ncbi:MAG: CARDB domain-containing protein [Patescibacteria group bacterium]|nr:CARDB domain-containing protein [Patescibacteria group bacterium]